MASLAERLKMFDIACTEEGIPLRAQDEQRRLILNPELAEYNKIIYKDPVLQARSDAGMVDDLFCTRTGEHRLFRFRDSVDPETGKVTLDSSLVPNPDARLDYASPDEYWCDMSRAVGALTARTKFGHPLYTLGDNDTLVPVERFAPQIEQQSFEQAVTVFSANGVAENGVLKFQEQILQRATRREANPPTLCHPGVATTTIGSHFPSKDSIHYRPRLTQLFSVQNDSLY